MQQRTTSTDGGERIQAIHADSGAASGDRPSFWWNSSSASDGCANRLRRIGARVMLHRPSFWMKRLPTVIPRRFEAAAVCLRELANSGPPDILSYQRAGGHSEAPKKRKRGRQSTVLILRRRAVRIEQAPHQRWPLLPYRKYLNPPA